jgi:hypothetical protein
LTLALSPRHNLIIIKLLAAALNEYIAMKEGMAAAVATTAASQ